MKSRYSLQNYVRRQHGRLQHVNPNFISTSTSSTYAPNEAPDRLQMQCQNIYLNLVIEPQGKACPVVDDPGLPHNVRMEKNTRAESPHDSVLYSVDLPLSR